MHANCFKGLTNTAVLHRIVNCLIVRLINRLCECFSLADGSGPLGKSITCLTGQRDLPWSVWWTISDNGPDLSVLHSTVLSWTSPKPPFAPRLLLATQGVVWTGETFLLPNNSKRRRETVLDNIVYRFRPSSSFVSWDLAGQLFRVFVVCGREIIIITEVLQLL